MNFLNVECREEKLIVTVCKKAWALGVVLVSCTTSVLAAPLTIEQANALDMPKRGETPRLRNRGVVAPEDQGVSSAAIADWVQALDREVKYVHAFAVLKNGHRIAEGAWAPHACEDRHSLYGLNGLFFADLIGRNLVCDKIAELPNEKVIVALQVKDVDHPNRETEAFWKLASTPDHQLDRNLLWMNRNFTQYLGFSWEGGCSAGDGLGRRTSVRNLALLGELHLRGGTWHGERLLNANFAAAYYRFVTRPSGLKVAFGERGQLLMVSPKDHLVLALTADTADREKMITLTEERLPSFGKILQYVPQGGESTAKERLAKTIHSLKLETCGEMVAPDSAVPFNRTYSLATNRYGFTTLRLASIGEKAFVLELGGRATQILKFAQVPWTQDVVFTDTKKALTSLVGKYRVSMTGGFVGPKSFKAILEALDTAGRFVWEIDFTDAAKPIFTIRRHGEDQATAVTGTPLEVIAGVKRDQARAEILWTHPIYKTRYVGWPTVCRRKNGEVLVAFSGNREGHVCPYGRSELIRSADNGETWSARSTIIHNDIVDDRDSSVLELPNGDLVAKWFGSTCFAGAYDQLFCKLPKNLVDAARGEWTKRSTDGGRTWTDLAPQIGHAPHGPILLRDGRLLQLGIASTREDMWNAKNYPERKPGLVVEESTDNGRSWHRLAFMEPQQMGDLSEPHLVECRDGRLLAMLRTNLRGCTMLMDSTDGGKTWSAPRESPFRIGGHPPYLSATSSGKILLTHCKRSEHLNVVYISDDDGRTWDLPHEIQLSKGHAVDMGYTSTAELLDGTFLSVYYAAENPGEPPCLMATKWRLR